MDILTEREMSECPLGWNYNPAAWSRRLPLLVLALAGFGLSSWFAFSPPGPSVAVPFLSLVPRFHFFFPNLHPWLPAPELAVSACGFLLQFLGSIIGGTRRWRTSPWLVVAVGFLLILLTGYNLSQTALQLVFEDVWCVPCFLASIISFLMIGPAMDEVLASLQHLKRIGHLRRRPWRSFCKSRSAFQMND